MNTIALRQFVTADADHTIHVRLPPGLSDRVEVIILPATSNDIPDDSLARAALMDESGFAKNILANPEEDCWNDL